MKNPKTGAESQPAIPAANGGSSPGEGARCKILVVDDNQDGARSLAMMLKLLGNEVETAHDGEQAFERAEQFQPRVILMDVGMPKLNGYDACRLIRQQEWGKEITIVAVTGWGEDNDRLRSQEAGCDSHLVKPIKLTDLETLLASVC